MIIPLLKFKFKGDREYVHGTDFYSHLVASLGTFKPGYLYKLQFKKFTNKQCFLTLEANADFDVIVEGLWSTESGNIRFYIVEENEPVTERYDFDEGAVVNAATTSNDSIVNLFNANFSMIENVVALTKRLHYTLFPIQQGKWVFAQLCVEQALPYQCGEIRVHNTHHLANKFTKNTIFIDGNKIGEIRFIVG